MWREGGDESGQTCLLTLDEISGRRMRELGSGSFIEIVEHANWDWVVTDSVGQ